MTFDLFLQLIVNGLITGGGYVLIAAGLTLIFGVLDVVNFAHGEMYMLGAYAAFVLASLGLPYVVAVVGAGVALAVLGLLAERAVFRPIRFTPPMNAIIASMGLSIVLANGALAIWSPTPRLLVSPLSDSLQLGLISISSQGLLVLVAAAALIVGLTLFVQRTWLGVGMRAVAQDITAARLMGINVDRVSQSTFAIGIGLAGAAGALVGPLVTIDPQMGSLVVLKAFAVVILGGVGNVQGAIFAGLLLGVTESLASGLLFAGYKDLIAFVVMILVLLVRPAGIWGRQAIER